MKKNRKKITWVLFSIIMLSALFVRLYKLNEIPAGVYLDEASLGYNAYSILLTGKDEFGKTLPIFFRSFSTFQGSLYGYFSIIPIYIFGLNIFSTRLVSVISGLVVIVVTFLFFYFSDWNNKYRMALFASLTVAFSPWAIYQSRVAVESNLGLALTAVGVLFLYLSTKSEKFIIPSFLIFGISSYAYAAQRITAILLPVAFLVISREYFSKNKKRILIGGATLLIVMAPQFFSLIHGGSLVRYQTQGYTQKSTFLKYGGSLVNLPAVIGQPLYIARQFTSQYLSAFSPRSLFFEPEPQLVRSIPDLSVFYTWMTIPFVVGIALFWKRRSDTLVKIFFLLMVIGVLPEAITGDPFYTLRMLPGIWGMTIMIAFGIEYIFGLIKNVKIRIILASFLIIVLGFNFYISYFVFLANERSIYFGYPFEVLAQITEENKDSVYILDSEMFDAPYIWMAFYKRFDPVKLQSQTPPGLLDHYYDDLTFYKYRTIGNVEVRKIDWGVDECKDEYLAGDIQAISDSQAIEHKLMLVKEISDKEGKTVIRIYKTNPELKCVANNS